MNIGIINGHRNLKQRLEEISSNIKNYHIHMESEQRMIKRCEEDLAKYTERVEQLIHEMNFLDEILSDTEKRYPELKEKYEN
jgi:chromosome segregation ATPase